MLEQERMDYSEPLSRRNLAIVEAVAELAVAVNIDAIHHKRISGDSWYKFIAVTGGPLFSDRLTVCGVSLINCYSGAFRAEFARAGVPEAMLEEFTDDPYELHNPINTERGVALKGPISTFKTDGRDISGLYPSIHKQNCRIKSAERLLDSVQQTFNNPQLNPHLSLNLEPAQV